MTTAAARAIIDGNRYMTLGTADASGRPWVTPVWFAPVAYREFLWVSDPDARHSRNLAVRPEVGMAIFDSQQPVGTGQGVYMEAVAEQLAGAALDEGIETLSRHLVEHGGEPWPRDRVVAPARHRLYRAVVSRHYVNDERDRRTPVDV